MPDTTISALPAAASAAAGAVVAADNAAGTATEKVTLGQVAALAALSAPVQSVAGKTGSVTLSVADVENAVSTSDARLTDARSPTAHTQAWSTITTTPTTLSGYGITDGVTTSDARLTDARQPTGHSASHVRGGSDAIVAAVSSPSALSADAHDYNFGTGSIVRLSATTSVAITGLQAGVNGDTLLLFNAGANAITLAHESSSSSAANRIAVPWLAGYSLAPSYSVMLVYFTATNRWHVI